MIKLLLETRAVALQLMRQENPDNQISSDEEEEEPEPSEAETEADSETEPEPEEQTPLAPSRSLKSLSRRR